MAFSISTFFEFVLVVTSFSNIDAFAVHPGTRLQKFLPTVTNHVSTTSSLCVTLSSIDNLISVEENDEDEPNFIVSAEDLDAPANEDFFPSDRFVHASNIQLARSKHRLHDTDSGSPEFQVAGMTERISYLTRHLKAHPKDFSTRRGLVALVNKRRRLLNFLYGESEERYVSLVKSLGIRHKAPGRVESREEKYGRFPGQKNKKKHQK
mmetsp:Transcript_53096/g.63948  ORF Transcript_53096/g.63948 Transcript_53096/m.63948 type:complete len:208 (-) Transcript_53096:23-646(-)|eukprot:CAMPEP_0172512804 /NCGR_PEP_ID=MMETSP1066-20121228/247284_1 /TAXON_ID=671091 /ORGANISM="Coscinodiscus wailesii, Strain CCMP2513" /LENGTH=207 /DNA_ID=CAMNT_0013292763 /DNA_START=72 /DNA_END=695 /DNA_ORIENTATION=+